MNERGRRFPTKRIRFLSILLLVPLLGWSAPAEARDSFDRRWSASGCRKGNAIGIVPSLVHDEASGGVRIEIVNHCNRDHSGSVSIEHLGEGSRAYRHGDLLEPAVTRPGWFRLLAVSPGGEAVSEAMRFVPSFVQQDTCHLRDFNLKGRGPNEIFYEPAPTFTWASASNHTSCLRDAGCKRSCSDEEGTRIRYRVFLDGVEQALLPEPEDCEPSWTAPPLDTGYHELILQAELLRGENPASVTAVRDVRYGFTVAVPPSSLEPLPAPWPIEHNDRPYAVTGSLRCSGGSCPIGPVALGITPARREGRGSSLVETLLGVTGNFAVLNQGDGSVFTELGRFAGGRLRSEDGGSWALSPRILPTAVTVEGSGARRRHRYANVSARARPEIGECLNRPGTMGCTNPSWRHWMPGRILYDARTNAEGRPIEEPQKVWAVHAVASEGSFPARERLYLGRVRLRVDPGETVRLRFRWYSQSPAPAGSLYPFHKETILRFEASPDRPAFFERSFLHRLTAPPSRGRGRVAAGEVAVVFETRAEYDSRLEESPEAAPSVLVQEVTLHEVREGFLAELGASAEGADADLFFDDFDAIPAYIQKDPPLLGEDELGALAGAAAPRGATRWTLPLAGSIGFRSFHRRVDAERAGDCRLRIFTKDGPFSQVGPHAGPAPAETVFVATAKGADAEVRGRRRVVFARNQRRSETVAFNLYNPCEEGAILLSPGKGRIALPDEGGILEYELWSSLPYLVAGAGSHNHEVPHDTPLVANLYLTKGGRPQFDLRRSRFRVDEEMRLPLVTSPGTSHKLIVDLEPESTLRPREEPYRVEIQAGPVVLPLLVRVVGVDLPPERNQWIQADLVRPFRDSTPEDGCELMTSALRDTGGRPACRSGWNAEYELHLCDDDLDILMRRVRERSLLGIYFPPTALRCQRLASCTGGPRVDMRCDPEKDPLGACPPDCGLDPAVPHMGNSPAVATARCTYTDLFTRVVRRIAAAWRSVEELPEGDPYVYDQVDLYPARGGRYPVTRPWLSVRGFTGSGGSPPWPHCWCDRQAAADDACPCDADPSTERCEDPCPPVFGITREHGPITFGMLRAIQDTGLDAWGMLATMDDLAGGGILRSSLASYADAFHDYGAPVQFTRFVPHEDQRNVRLLERARMAEGLPEDCWDLTTCEGVDAVEDLASLQRLLRWGPLYTSDWSGTGQRCPPRPRAWQQVLAITERRMQLADHPGGRHRHVYCPEGCRYVPEERHQNPILCPGGRIEMSPYGSCVNEETGIGCSICAFPDAPGLDWCTTYAPEPERRIELPAYSIGGPWLVRTQEACRPGEPEACRGKCDGADCLSPERSEQVMWSTVMWKWPLNTRFIAGFWTAASNVDGFHPYKLLQWYWGITDPFSNFHLWGQNLPGFLYITQSRAPEEGESCSGPCSGLVMTESWQALGVGYTDLRWWDALVQSKPGDAACRTARRELLDEARRAYLAFFASNAGRDRSGGYVAEVFGDGELQRFRHRIIEHLDRCVD